MFSAIWKAILLALGIVSKGEDIVKTKQANDQRTHDEQQGEQNANAKGTADALNTVVQADRAADSDAVLKRVRDRFERP